MGVAYSTQDSDKKYVQRFNQNLDGIEELADSKMNGDAVLKWILQIQDTRV
jgi:hypothetical protein